MITIALRKSAVRPRASVSRPSPSAESSASKTSGCAFSISSSSTTQNGCSRTRRRQLAALAVAGCQPEPISFATASPLPYSPMSKRITRSRLPNRNSASALASSVLPTPVGPTKKSVASGLPGSCRPGLEDA